MGLAFSRVRDVVSRGASSAQTDEQWHQARSPVELSAVSERSGVKFAVAICTYNGAERLPLVLASLKRQLVPAHILWGVLVIDNNSTDATQATVQQFQQGWPAGSFLQYCHEPRQGTAFARQHAVQVANADFVGFIDDDNLPEQDWVAQACQFGECHIQVGAFGSRINGHFERPLPQHFDRIQSFFAITQRGEVPHRYERRCRVLPPAAGLVVRRQVWLDHVPELILLGASGRKRLAGEDLEALSHIQNANWEVWHNPAMRIEHRIPAWRMEHDYLMRFFKSIGLSRHVTRMLGVRAWQRPIFFLAYAVNDLRKIVRHWLRYSLRSRPGLVEACELQLYIHSLISPLYIWWLLIERAEARSAQE